jgi:hypothetical protein
MTATDITRDPIELKRELAEAGRAHDLYASLYVVLDRMHRSTMLKEVIAAVEESLMNLVGTEDYALFLRDDKSARFFPLVAQGEGKTLHEFCVGDVGLGEIALRRTPHTVYHRRSQGDEAPEPGHLIAAPMLDSKGESNGVIVVLRMLAHKRFPELREHKIVEAMAAHAGFAIENALLRSALTPVFDVGRLRDLLGSE